MIILIYIPSILYRTSSHGSHGEAGAHHTGAETGHPASTPATDGRSNIVTVRQFKSARTRDTRTFLLTDMPSVPEPTEDLQAKPHPDAAGQGPNHGPKRSNTLR